MHEFASFGIRRPWVLNHAMGFDFVQGSIGGTTGARMTAAIGVNLAPKQSAIQQCTMDFFHIPFFPFDTEISLAMEEMAERPKGHHSIVIHMPLEPNYNA